MFISTLQPKNNFLNRVLEFIGDISYGVYMFHPFVMYICFAVINHVLFIENMFLYNLTLYFTVFSLAIGLSYISFHYFESKFIKLKVSKFTVISSGR
jgi:peptidoglycan/LPS O-acetylase OafA/YrhL